MPDEIKPEAHLYTIMLHDGESLLVKAESLEALYNRVCGLSDGLALLGMEPVTAIVRVDQIVAILQTTSRLENLRLEETTRAEVQAEVMGPEEEVDEVEQAPPSQRAPDWRARAR